MWLLDIFNTLELFISFTHEPCVQYLCSKTCSGMELLKNVVYVLQSVLFEDFGLSCIEYDLFYLCTVLNEDLTSLDSFI